MKRNKRQSQSNFDEDDLEAASEEVNPRSHTVQLTQELGHQSNETRPMGQETDQTLNPDNPYNVSICTVIFFQSLRLCWTGAMWGLSSFFFWICTIFACSAFPRNHRLVKHLRSSKSLPSVLFSQFPLDFSLKQAQVLEIIRLRRVDAKFLLRLQAHKETALEIWQGQHLLKTNQSWSWSESWATLFTMWRESSS